MCRVENVLRIIVVGLWPPGREGKCSYVYTYDLDGAISANASIYYIIMCATTIYDGCSYQHSAAAVAYTYEFIWIDMTSVKTEFYVSLYLDQSEKTVWSDSFPSVLDKIIIKKKK